MNYYLLVHGAWHSPYCWHKVMPYLKKQNNTAICIDLTVNSFDLAKKITLIDYAKKVAQQINLINKKRKDKIILVGHSLGGAVISQVLKYTFNIIDQLCYVCAYLLAPNSSVIEEYLSDEYSQLKINQLTNENNLLTLNKKVANRVFYNESLEFLNDIAYQHLYPQPTLVLSNKLKIKSYNNINKIYVFCTNDKCLSYNKQRQLVKKTPCNQTFTLVSDHSPFYCKAKEFSEILLSLSRL